MKRLIIFNIILIIIYLLTNNIEMVDVNLEEIEFQTDILENKLDIIENELNITNNITNNETDITENESDIMDIIQNNTITENVSSRGAEPRTTEPRTTEPKNTENKLEGYRITSYYPGDNCATGTKTGSGKSTKDFTLINIDGKNVYAYESKIVVAGATNELLKSGYNVKGSQKKQDKHYFNYYDTGKIKINDKWYDFIVLDSCGASMWEGYYRLDIFVPDSKNMIDTKNIEIIYN